MIQTTCHKLKQIAGQCDDDGSVVARVDLGANFAVVASHAALRSTLLDIGSENKAKPLPKKALTSLLTGQTRHVLDNLRGIAMGDPETTAAHIKKSFAGIDDDQLRGASAWVLEFASRVLSWFIIAQLRAPPHSVLVVVFVLAIRRF